MLLISADTANNAQGGADLLPLILGVTGHRDIQEIDLSAIEAALGAEWIKIQAAGPATPLILLSPLAEGADRLAAKLFLRLRAEGKIHQLSRLFVPLPYDIEDYRQSFTEAAHEFDELLGQADKVFVVPELTVKNDAWNTGEPPTKASTRGYEALGVYLVEHCHVLVALWDGKKSGRAGGTSRVVEMRQSGLLPYKVEVENAIEPPTGGSVVHIWVRRASAPADEPAPASGTMEFLPPKGLSSAEGEEALKLTIKRLDMFNSHAAQLENISMKRFFPLDKQQECLTASERMVIRLSSQASMIAGKYSDIERNGLLHMVRLGVLAILFLSAFNFFRYWWLLGLGGLCVLGILGVFLLIKLSGCQNKHLTCRGLLEALRVFFFWRIGGVPDDIIKKGFSEEKVMDSGDARWMREAIACVDILSADEAVTNSQDSVKFRKAQVLPEWVRHQQAYFAKSAARNEEKYRFFLLFFIGTVVPGSALALICFFLRLIPYIPSGAPLIALFIVATLAMLITAVGLFYQLLPYVERRTHRVLLWLLLTFCILGWILPAAFGIADPVLDSLNFSYRYLLLPASALLGVYIKLSAFSENAKRYKKYDKLFSQAEELLLEETDEEKIQDILIYLGKKALNENSVWLRQHIDRPINIPVSRQVLLIAQRP